MTLGFFERALQLIEREGLGEIVAGAAAHEFHGGGDGRVGSHDHHGGRRCRFSHLAEKVCSVPSGEVQIQEDDVHWSRLKKGAGAGQRFRCAYLKAQAQGQFRTDLADGGVVFNDEQMDYVPLPLLASLGLQDLAPAASG
jgi:hypothetical protein